MKIIKKLILFVVVLAISLSAVACKGCNKDNPDEKEQSSYGTHVNNVTDTNEKFITNGKTEYSLVIPQKMSKLLTDAKEDFVYLFKKATGIDIQVIKDTGLTHKAENKYISLGDTELFSSSGLEKATDLGFDGYQIFTKDHSYYLIGGYDDGSAYSIYSFFELLFNYEAYYSDCVVIDENVKDLNFKILDVKEIPDVAARCTMTLAEMSGPTSDTPDSKYLASRWKSVHWKSVYQLPVHKYYDKSSSTEYSHSILWAVPKDVHFANHPKWFAESGTQLCYTARGDESEFELMAQEVAKKVIFSYTTYDKENYPYANIIHFGISDDYNSCFCDNCKELNDRYGTESGAWCIFFNRVGDIFKAWEQGTPIDELFDPSIIGEDASWMGVDPTPYIREGFRITFFAYNSGIIAPVNYDKKSDTYTPIDDKVILRDNIGVFLADVERDWQKGFYSEQNEYCRINMGAWASLTDTIWYWSYGRNFNNGLCFYDNFDSITTEEYSFMARNSIKMSLLEMSAGLNSRQTNWEILMAYLHYKLLWNSSLDTNVLIDNWFKAMFNEASETMKELFFDMRTYTAQVVAENGGHTKNSIFSGGIASKKYWKKQTLKSWIDMCDLAESYIEHYKATDPEYYEVLRGHIKTEYVFPAYNYLYIYGEELDPAVKKAMIKEMQEDAVKYNLTNMYGYGNKINSMK
jgi:hypothetical protein